MSDSHWTQARADIKALVDAKGCGPILIRLAWHDAGTYDQVTKTGGPRASMRFAPESGHGANAGLQIARDLLQPIKDKYPQISYADFWQLAGVVAVEAMGGPKVVFRPGRVDAASENDCAVEGRLPDATQGRDHLRWVFTEKMGFNDEEIVALSGAHAVGHCHADRSGFVGPWTTRPLTFSNEYFTLLTKPEGFWTPKPNTKQFQDPTGALMMLPTDLVLVQDPAFKPYVEKYAASEQVFFEDFAKVFQRLGELGWEGKLGNPV